MNHPKRPPPEVDHVTPELEALLAQFSDEEIATGVITPTAAAVRAERSEGPHVATMCAPERD